jgi:hypothetical protein
MEPSSTTSHIELNLQILNNISSKRTVFELDATELRIGPGCAVLDEAVKP